MIIKLLFVYTDGIVGEVLFWVLRHVLGPTVYTPNVQQAWVKIYCRMIRTIIPVAVALELHEGPAQNQADRSNLETNLGLSMNPQEKSALSQLRKDDESRKEPLQSEMIREGESTKSHHSHGRHVVSHD